MICNAPLPDARCQLPAGHEGECSNVRWHNGPGIIGREVTWAELQVMFDGESDATYQD